jgi:cytochrome c oxidase subunit 2
MLSIINTPATSFTKVMKALQKKAGRSLLGAALLGLACLLQSPALLAAWELNMPKGVTEISRATYDLHMTIIWMCVAIGVIVYGVLVYSMVKYRKSKGVTPATFHHNTTVEIIWTAIPFILLIGMAIPSTKVLTQIYDATESEIDILVTGHQWRWQYEYLNGDGEPVSFFSNMTTPDEQIYNLADKGENYLLEVDEPMVIPVNTKVRLLLTASDVIHSWWVPEFSVKKDTIPGFINESWVIAEETGTFRGQCTELCGQLHGFMPVVVEVVERDVYDAWFAEKQAAAEALAELASQDWTLEQLVAQGQTVYTTFCMACHQANGQGLPPAFPSLVGSPLTVGPIEGHIDIVLNGSPGTSMAAFGNLLSPVDLAAVITYERNTWGNDVGDMVTPVEILEIRANQ